MNKVAVAVLNWNGKNLLEKYLPSVIEHSPEADIIVIDNNSSDDSVSFLNSEFPEVQVLQTGNNEGYAGGYNIGLSQIKHEYVVLLNSDVEVTKGWLTAQLALFDKDPSIGACQPIVLDDKRKTHFEYAGAAGGFIDYLGYPFCRGRLFDHLEENLGQYNQSGEIFWATGACLMVRRKAFMDAGQLDTRFFAHMEEIDLCWRMKNIGYKVMYCAESKVYHLGGATLDAQSQQKTYLNFRNNLYLLFKNLPSTLFFPVLFLRLILDGMAGVKFIFEFKLKHALAIVRAHFSFYGNFISLAKERNLRMRSQKIEGFDTSGVYNRMIIWDFYFKKRKVFSTLPDKFSK